ncbi:serine/threonine-protein kinase [Nocardiopsis alba]|uniref:Serine/threonine-protein kinase n=2 Tax=Nocardiopsis alba TaxID=53437 RepID=A0ABV5DY88_9ACTN|nr:serine/threonine-protein kinase [Nocardiopsis alba]AFR06823.1 phosphotransferase enzyme family protein [Nocardiopsis alba ATCC BAA-2165]
MPSDGLPKNLEPLAAGDPATIGPYVLSGKLGSGGMGTVYLGSTPEKNHQVAIKVIRPELAFDEQTRARFRDEMENARKVASFCTAKVLDHGTFENRPYMVTEYIAGTALAEHIAENGPLDSSTLHGFALGVAAALAAIHRTGLVHRDLKPANVLLSISGPRVIDFGIARAMNTATNHTQTGIVMGSPGWMAPEQLLEEKVTTSADIFAWGCLVAFAGSGTHPFGNGDAMTLGKRVLFAEPRLTGLAPPLDRLVARALAKEPGRRPTAQDLLLELAGGEDTSNPNDMVSHALHQSWRPNLPPMPPGPPGMPHPGHQTMTGMRHPAPGQYQAAPPMPPPAHQTGNFTHQAHQQHPGHPPQNGPGQAHPAQAQHPAATGPIPMVPPPEQQQQQRAPQPYVPPVPPPPHRPASPGKRRGVFWGLVIGGAVLLLSTLLVIVLALNGQLSGQGSSDGAGDGKPGTTAPPEDAVPPAEGADKNEPPSAGADGSYVSLDGTVRYQIDKAHCVDELAGRSAATNGKYCVIEVTLENLGEQAIDFDAGLQQMVTSERRWRQAMSPTSGEGKDSLWSTIEPGTAASGRLVFVLAADEDPDSLELYHHPDEDSTRADLLTVEE